ncbi:hypothetical protein SK128_024952, partial [Halocaridina rubra]
VKQNGTVCTATVESANLKKRKLSTSNDSSIWDEAAKPGKVMKYDENVDLMRMLLIAKIDQRGYLPPADSFGLSNSQDRSFPATADPNTSKRPTSEESSGDQFLENADPNTSKQPTSEGSSGDQLINESVQYVRSVEDRSDIEPSSADEDSISSSLESAVGKSVASPEVEELIKGENSQVIHPVGSNNERISIDNEQAEDAESEQTWGEMEADLDEEGISSSSSGFGEGTPLSQSSSFSTFRMALTV